ncbi:MAG: nicotinate-nucleotide--dimethylbenzimidazole phosphoribosyltransferase [Magnetococcales bacterium]|nr:nicotinate-nucleotide--dimethylbenzimidazole phosphoribosyltransferase [Magnetococcales bacterium]MBF0321423.1 nicotinate-nucleotide--dimethylbenzimidazole phosphoribosyltransferase [Magnetococcales bacterium]
MTQSWWLSPAQPLVESARQQAVQRLNQLTKPKGSLGVMEELVAHLAAMQGTPIPVVDPGWITVFAADHGVARAGVSAYPQAVTVEMIRNFSRGGAAITVLARQQGIPFEVVDVGAVTDPGPLPWVISHRVGEGTADFRYEPAMTPNQLYGALDAGRAAVKRALEAGSRLFIGGEMGIGNTTASAAITVALLGMPPESVAGPGTGVDEAGMARKAAIIQEAWTQNEMYLTSPLEILRCLGGFEIAALCGAYIHCAQKGLPILVDGVICTAAALVVITLHPAMKDWMIFTHRSSEPGQLPILRAIAKHPVLDLQMRLGEGSGAATAFAILRLACALQQDMATFAEAAVSRESASHE